MRNYGNDYQSRDDDFYLNGEYGTTSPVSLSAIGEAAASRVNSDTLSQGSLDTDYDYTNAQYNTDRAREQWQKDPSQRTADFKLFAKKWYNDSANYGRTQADMIGDYNKLIDSMYDFKHGMAAPERSGANSYFYDDSVGQFNRNNRSAYASANTPGNVHGYDERQEDWNGSITAQRFIDRTDDDVTDFDWGFGDDDDEGYRALFSNLGKDKTGRYFIKSSSDDEDGSNTYGHPGSGDTGSLGQSGSDVAVLDGNDEYDYKSKRGLNEDALDALANIDVTPEALRAMSLGEIQHLNSKLRKNRGLLNLQSPDHYETQVTGDLPTQQQYNDAGAAALHTASRNSSADSAQNMASMLEANNTANKYYIQGKAANDQAYEKSLEANQKKNEHNRQSDYSAAMNNRNAIFQKRVNDQALEAKYQRYKHDANQNYIDEIWKNLYGAREQRMQQQKAYNSQSLRNDIYMNPDRYGLDWDDETMELMDAYMSGKITVEDMQKDGTYDKFKDAYRQAQLAYDENWAKMNGLRYKGYHPLYDDYDENESDPSKYDSMFDIIESDAKAGKKAKGGKVDTTEKIEIQKLRSKVSEMNAFQKHISKKVDTLAKDMDRLERSTAKYIQGMKIKV